MSDDLALTARDDLALTAARFGAALRAGETPKPRKRRLAATLVFTAVFFVVFTAAFACSKTALVPASLASMAATRLGSAATS